MNTIKQNSRHLLKLQDHLLLSCCCRMKCEQHWTKAGFTDLKLVYTSFLIHLNKILWWPGNKTHPGVPACFTFLCTLVTYSTFSIVSVGFWPTWLWCFSLYLDGLPRYILASCFTTIRLTWWLLRLSCMSLQSLSPLIYRSPCSALEISNQNLQEARSGSLAAVPSSLRLHSRTRTAVISCCSAQWSSGEIAFLVYCCAATATNSNKDK